MKIFVPTDKQRDAIDCDTSAVITACPGSGKTAVVSAKVRNVLTNSPEFRGVIAISYTNKASAELRKRCAENAYDVKRSYFGTIDKFCISEIILPFFPFLFDGNTGKPEIISKHKLEEDNLTVFEKGTGGTQEFLHSMATLYERGIVEPLAKHPEPMMLS